MGIFKYFIRFNFINILFSKCIMTDTSQLAVSLFKLNEKIGDMEINAQTIIMVTKFSMEVVEATKLKGAA
ncbi:hypothetical protein DRO61_07580, partial [Candidatus Bathyarchaeota archaeon]